LTGCTSLDVFSDKGFDVGPPVIGGNKLESFGNAGVSRCFIVVKKCNYVMHGLCVIVITVTLVITDRSQIS
jgi:hypothetical protein